MQVDKVAMSQGIINAHNDKKISDELYLELTPVEKAEYERKLEAIKILLAAKADGSIS